MPRPPLKGTINIDVRDSVPDWDPYMPPRAPEGSPNVLIVLYDDTGLAAWEPFGGRGRFGGHALYLQDRRAHYVYNFLGVPPEQLLSSGELAPGRCVIGMDFAKDHVGDHGETVGTARLHVDDQYIDLEQEAMAALARE